MKLRAIALFAAGAGLLALATAATAGPDIPPVAAIASDLGVGVDELVSCANDARARAEPPRGSAERKAAVEALVLSCLQDTRPEITAAQLDAALAKYRPAQASTN